MNIYRCQFVVNCPSNGKAIPHSLEIRHFATLPVESLLDVVSELPSMFQEGIADLLYAKFGGEQVIKANHHGVEIETVRGSL